MEAYDEIADESSWNRPQCVPLLAAVEYRLSRYAIVFAYAQFGPKTRQMIDVTDPPVVRAASLFAAMCRRNQSRSIQRRNGIEVVRLSARDDGVRDRPAEVCKDQVR
jgi:hypothetical protein